MQDYKTKEDRLGKEKPKLPKNFGMLQAELGTQEEFESMLKAKKSEELGRLIQEVDDAILAKENDEWALDNVMKDVAMSERNYNEAMKNLHAFVKENPSYDK